MKFLVWDNNQYSKAVDFILFIPPPPTVETETYQETA